ncbi:MBL fold metallo-hydrolase [Sphingomonas parva]|nr:MBL fold metallo-hydrolase [Sphingomonas parva]
MRAFLRWAGTVLLFTMVAICLAPSVAMPFLDRIYYEGPASDHFDGARFFNPGVKAASHGRGGPATYLNRWIKGDQRAAWPEHVPVSPSKPPVRVDGQRMLVTWVGHATVLVQTQGLNILTDPVWSERASPFSFAGPKRVRAPGVRMADLPKIDLVLISHNHYDHLDLATLKQLWARDRPKIVTGLGNDTILRTEGIEAIAADWGEEVPIGPAAGVRILRNHHWSSRWGVDRNRALWSAFSVRLPGGSIFFAGDTGMSDGRWVDEAATRGPYRLAILPIGAYAPRDFMKNHHVDPDEAAAIFARLGAKHALGIHWGTFQLTFEAIDEPRQRLEALKRTARGRMDGFVTSEAGQSFEVPAA